GIGDDIFGIEFARLGDDEAKLVGGNRQIGDIIRHDWPLGDRTSHGTTTYQTALISIKTTGDTDCGPGDGIDKRSDLDPLAVRCRGHRNEAAHIMTTSKTGEKPEHRLLGTHTGYAGWAK